MAEESYGFSKARTRLDEIVGQVRKKDTSLEKSLDLLEEGVRLANQCTELIDQSEWDAAAGRSHDAEDVSAADAIASPEDSVVEVVEIAEDARPSEDEAATR